MAKWDLTKLDEARGGDVKAQLQHILDRIDALQARLDELERSIPEVYK